MIKLYLSQANQGHNAGPGGYTEKAGMDALTRRIAVEFKKDSRFKVYRNTAGDRIDTASANGLEANRLGVDYYIAWHSNAGGPGARGTFGYYHDKGSKGYKVAAAIVDAISPLSPGPGKALIAMPGFIELHTPNAPACLIEVEAHDWATGVKFITEQKNAIAKAAYEGICRGLGLKPLSDAPPKPVPNYIPLKKAAIKVADALRLEHSKVNLANTKGEAFEALLRSIADHKG